MVQRPETDIEKYLQQQIELGYREFYLPASSRPRDPRRIKPLPLDRFAESESLMQLEKTIQVCQKCALGKTRTRFVFGCGSPDAEIMFVGEAPGRDEDLQGVPFVGRAGKLLDKILGEVGLKRDEVYIANILKCRPPDNRDPLPEEVDECEPHLLMQIKLIKPKIICALGRIAAQTLLKSTMSLATMRGRWFDYRGIRFMVTYHSAAILRNPAYMKPTIEDLQRLIAELERIKGVPPQEG